MISSLVHELKFPLGHDRARPAATSLELTSRLLTRRKIAEIRQLLVFHDLGLVLEDELALHFARIPLIRQRLFLIRHYSGVQTQAGAARRSGIAAVDPPSPNIMRTARVRDSNAVAERRAGSGRYHCAERSFPRNALRPCPQGPDAGNDCQSAIELRTLSAVHMAGNAPPRSIAEGTPADSGLVHRARCRGGMQAAKPAYSGNRKSTGRTTAIASAKMTA